MLSFTITLWYDFISQWMFCFSIIVSYFLSLDLPHIWEFCCRVFCEHDLIWERWEEMMKYAYVTPWVCSLWLHWDVMSGIVLVFRMLFSTHNQCCSNAFQLKLNGFPVCIFVLMLLISAYVCNGGDVERLSVGWTSAFGWESRSWKE